MIDEGGYVNNRLDQRGQAAASGGSGISSEEELRKAQAAIQEYERRKAEVRRVLKDVLAAECVSQDGLLTEMLSEGYRERTGNTVESAMVSDYLSEIADRLSLPKNPKKDPPGKKPGQRGPRPVAIVGAGGEERHISGGWTGVLRFLAQVVDSENRGREDIWESLPFVQPKHLLPGYLQQVVANVEVAPGLWLNTHGDAKTVQVYIRMMLDAFSYPPNRWRFRLDNGRLWKV